MTESSQVDIEERDLRLDDLGFGIWYLGLGIWDLVL